MMVVPLDTEGSEQPTITNCNIAMPEPACLLARVLQECTVPVMLTNNEDVIVIWELCDGGGYMRARRAEHPKRK